MDGNLDLGFDFQFRAQIAHADDQILQDRHFCLGCQIELLLVGLRETEPGQST